MAGEARGCRAVQSDSSLSGMRHRPPMSHYFAAAAAYASKR